MTDIQRWQWIVDVCTQTGSLLFLWQGEMGTQPVLMPGYTYYWWLDDSANLHKETEGRGRRDRDRDWRH